MSQLYNIFVGFSFFESIDNLQESGSNITLDNLVENFFQADPVLMIFFSYL